MFAQVDSNSIVCFFDEWATAGYGNGSRQRR